MIGNTVHGRLERIFGIPDLSGKPRLLRALGLERVEAYVTHELQQARRQAARKLERIFGVPARDSSRRLRRALGIEQLECRLVMSASLGAPEMLVNNWTDDSQELAPESQQSVSMNDTGDFVVAWSSQGQDGSGSSVHGRRFDNNGVAKGNEFQINATTAGDQDQAAVASNNNGDIVVTWSSDGQDGDRSGIVGRRYDANMDTWGDEFQVNVRTENHQERSAVAMDDDGNIVVTWSSRGQDGDSNSRWNVYARTFDADGTGGAEFLVNTDTTGNQQESAIAMDSGGDFVISWHGWGAADSNGVYVQQFDSSGTAVGGQTLVNVPTTGNQIDSAVAMDDAGGFVVTWSGQGGIGYDVHAQRFDASGTALGGEFVVNTKMTSNQEHSAVAMDADGDFVVSWTSKAQDGSKTGVYAQQFSADGAAVGDEFQVNGTTAGDQRYSAVAMDAGGEFVVAWTGNGVGDVDGVFVRRSSIGDGGGGDGTSDTDGDTSDTDGDTSDLDGHSSDMDGDTSDTDGDTSDTDGDTSGDGSADDFELFVDGGVFDTDGRGSETGSSSLASTGGFAGDGASLADGMPGIAPGYVSNSGTGDGETSVPADGLVVAASASSNNHAYSQANGTGGGRFDLSMNSRSGLPAADTGSDSGETSHDLGNESLPPQFIPPALDPEDVAAVLAVHSDEEDSLLDVVSASLDSLADALQGHSLTAAERAVAFGSATFTVGYVAYALKDLSWIAGLAASTPSWRRLDPLAVLKAQQRKKRNGRAGQPAGFSEFLS